MIRSVNKQSLSLLLIEDSAEDAEILLSHLALAGLHISFLRVDTVDAMAKALANGIWDLVISDYAMPQFSGMKALELLHAKGIDIPFILVSGAIGEDIAVLALKAGAHDFIAKGKLARLVPAIERELREADDRRKHREAQDSLYEMQEIFAAIGEAASDAILVLDAHFQISYWNPMAERLFGSPPKYALGGDLFKLAIEPGCRDQFQQHFQSVLSLDSGATLGRTIELTGRNKYGRSMPLEISLSAVMLKGRWHAVAILRDISHRKAMEQEWVEQLRFFRTVVETIPNPVFYKDVDGHYLGCNQAFTQYIGLPREELIGKTLMDLTPTDLVSSHSQADHEVIRTGCCCTYESEVVHRDGRRRAVIESKAPFFDNEGKVAGIVGTMLDITERRQAEIENANLQSQLNQAQKLEAIGQLAAGIAHEINTPTQFIGDNTRFLKDAFRTILAFMQAEEAWLREAPEPLSGPLQSLKIRLHALDVGYLVEEIPKALDQTLDGVSRVARIVGAMKDFGHLGLESKVHTDLNRSIESTLTISHNEWKFVAEVETDYDSSLPPVPCFPGELNQVILNLVVNAAHAIQEVKSLDRPDFKGKIQISTRQVDNEAIIRIQDNGTGIPKAIQKRVFEPFFTTKPVGKGTGQGLAIAHSVIVDKHRGRLMLESEPGMGTTFIVALPMGS